MARKRKIEARAFNIVAHPHSTATYLALFDAVWHLKYPVKVRGDEFVLMRSVRTREQEQDTRFEGQFAKFTRIDPERPWFNMARMEKADEGDVQSIFIPEDIRPNYSSFSFIFCAESHTLVYEAYSYGKTLSVNMLQKYLENVFALDPIIEKFGEISVSPVASEDSLAHVFSLDRIRRVTITYFRPNPDNLEDAEAKIARRMERMRAAKETREINAQRGASLDPQADEETAQLAEVATRSGEVIAFGRDKSGASVHRSTRERPKAEVDRFDPETETETQAFRRIASRLTGQRGN